MSRTFWWLCTLAVLMVILFVGCMSSVTTLQSPKVLDPGEKALGVGVAGHLDVPYRFIRPLQVDLSARLGLVDRLDVGLRLYLFGAYGDVKYQMLRKPIFLSAVLGFSYGNFLDLERSESWLGWYPMLLVGDEHLYGGIRIIHLRVGENSETGTHAGRDSYTVPMLLVGTSLGSKTKVIPELGLHFARRDYDVRGETGWRAVPVLGIGLQRHF